MKRNKSVMAKPEETRGKVLSFFFRETKVFSPKSVVNLKNEQNIS